MAESSHSGSFRLNIERKTDCQQSNMRRIRGKRLNGMAFLVWFGCMARCFDEVLMFVCGLCMEICFDV